MSEFSHVKISSSGLSFVVISAPSCRHFRAVWPLGIYPIRASLTMGACCSVLQACCTCTSHQYFVSHHYLILFHTLLQSYGLYTCTVLLLFCLHFWQSNLSSLCLTVTFLCFHQFLISLVWLESFLQRWKSDIIEILSFSFCIPAVG